MGAKKKARGRPVDVNKIPRRTVALRFEEDLYVTAQNICSHTGQKITHVLEEAMRRFIRNEELRNGGPFPTFVPRVPNFEK